MRKLLLIASILGLSTLSFAQVGSLVNTYGTNGATNTPIGLGNEEVRKFEFQTDGKVVAVGYTVVGATTDIAVVRYNQNGTLDNTFGTGGIVQIDLGGGNDDAFGVEIDGSGRIIVIGETNSTPTYDFFCIRLNSDGTFDNTFSGDGILTVDIDAGSEDHGSNVKFTSTGKIVIAGYRNKGCSGDFAVVRINTDGTLDNTFSGDGIVTTGITGCTEDFISSLVVQSDDKIIASGSSKDVDYDFAMARYNTDGTLDATFGTGGIVVTPIGPAGISDDHCYGIALQADGKIVRTGWTRASTSSDFDFATARYNTDGSLDNTFGTGGIVITNIGPGATEDQARAVALMKDGHIIIAGNSDNGDFTLVRYNSNGTLDNLFSGDGIATADLAGGQNDFVRYVKMRDQYIYAGGYISNAGNKNFSIAAFQNDGFSLPFNDLAFAAQRNAVGVELTWKALTEKSLIQYNVEKSTDGRNFKSLGAVAAVASQSKFNFVDKEALLNTTFYRLAMVSVDGKITYSNAVVVRNSAVSSTLEVYPSLVTSTVNLQIPAGIKGRTQITVTDFSGRILSMSTMELQGTAITTSLDVNRLSKGMYNITVSADGGNVKLTSRFVKQ